MPASSCRKRSHNSATPGSASFTDPELTTTSIQISKNIALTESKSFDVRVEAFNVLSHPQFYGPTSVNGEVNDPNFGGWPALLRRASSRRR